MTELQELSVVSLEEFEAMEQKEGWNYELIDGTIMMSPRPSISHQRISGKLFMALSNALNGQDCEPLQEVDLLLNENHLVPDIMVVCGELSEGNHCEKAPLIVIEILSPSSINRDHFTKRIKYEQLGIQEYWIVSAEDKCIMVISYVANSQEMYCTGVVKSAVMPDLQIELNKIFTV